MKHFFFYSNPSVTKFLDWQCAEIFPSNTNSVQKLFKSIHSAPKLCKLALQCNGVGNAITVYNNKEAGDNNDYDDDDGSHITMGDDNVVWPKMQSHL